MVSTRHVHREVESLITCSGSAEVHSTMPREWEGEERSGTGAFKPLSTPSEHMLRSGDWLLLDQPARHMNVKCCKATGTSHSMS